MSVLIATSPNCAMVTVSLFCNEILVRFRNLTAIFGLRHSPFLFKTHSCSSYKISLKLNSKLVFFPHLSPTRASLGCGHSGLIVVGEETLDLLLTRFLCAFSSSSPFSSPPFGHCLSGATFLSTISEEEKILLMRLQHVRSEK